MEAVSILNNNSNNKCVLFCGSCFCGFGFVSIRMKWKKMKQKAREGGREWVEKSVTNENRKKWIRLKLYKLYPPPIYSLLHTYRQTMFSMWTVSFLVFFFVHYFVVATAVIPSTSGYISTWGYVTSKKKIHYSVRFEEKKLVYEGFFLPFVSVCEYLLQTTTLSNNL